ncbi:TPR repeat-containing protein DDB_G0287407-like [Symsagittifera roscoffensis]|uniref:TPR repeat-containing protein DDB_G0287407-like n=1 Tax=Symsagittifera roscoffensis TaxID=84072 RepID=UPI00307BFADA
MASSKRTVRVFYSSPFRGLEREREMLSAVYWPRVSQACAQRGVSFVPIDFRWGITEESSSAANTVAICLRQVQQSDIFVGFFGARYGWHGSEDPALQQAIDKALPENPWLSEFRDRSVTEMEFLEGRLRNPDSKRPAAFFFRDSEYDKEMFQKMQTSDPKEAKVYSAEIDGEKAGAKLQELKEYTVKYKDSLTEESASCSVEFYKTPQEGAQLMFEATMNMLNKYFLNNELEHQQSKFDKWIEGQSNYMATQHTLGSRFLGRSEEQKKLAELIQGDKNWRVVVKGEEGCGKSALLINHVLEYEQNSKDSLHIYYNMSAYPGANSSLSCLQFLAAYLEKYNGEEKAEQSLKLSKFSDLLGKISSTCEALKEKQGRQVIFFLDGIDKIESQKHSDIPLGFLPKRLPLKQVVCTKLEDKFHFPRIEEHDSVSSLVLDNFQLHEAMDAVESALDIRGKTLNQVCLQVINKCEQIRNLLFLKVLLEQLFSHAQFSSLEAEVTDLCTCSSISEIFELFLSKLEKVMCYEASYEHGSAGDALCYLALSHHGLMETELRELVGWEARLWATFFSTVRPSLLDNNEVYSIQYSQLTNAIFQKHLNSEQKLLKYRTSLANYFQKKLDMHLSVNRCFDKNSSVPERIIQELPAALFKAGMHRELQECLLNVTFFRTSSIGDRTADRATEVYKSTPLEAYEYAKYLKETTDDFSDVVKIFRRNVENVFLAEMCPRYSSFSKQATDLDRIGEGTVVLSKFFDFVDEAIGMPGVTSELMETAIVIQRGSMAQNRQRKQEDEAIKEEIYLAELYNRLAISLTYQNKFVKAICYLNKCLAIKRIHTNRTDLISDIDRRVAITLHTLGNAYKQTKDIELAIPCFEEARKIHSIDNAEQQWSSLDGLASCYFFKRDFEKAEELYQKVVDHYDSLSLTTTDNLYAGFICNLANAIRRRGRLGEARVLYKKAWDIQIKILGDTHHSIAVTLMCLGNLEMASKNFQDCVTYFEKAYYAYKKTTGLICHETALAAENIAVGYSRTEDFEKGTPWFHHGGELLEKLGLLHMTLPWMNRKYLKYHYEQGNQDEVEKILERMAKVNIDPGNYKSE